jgi:hypothetical protein
MTANACGSCGFSLDRDSRFCSYCGKPVSGAKRSNAAQLMTAGVIGLELLAMLVMSLFVAPRLRAAFSQFNAQAGGLAQLLLHPAWLPSFMGAVALLGGLAVFKRMGTAPRVLLVSAALILGLIPMFGTVAAVYVIEFQVAASVGQP